MRRELAREPSIDCGSEDTVPILRTRQVMGKPIFHPPPPLHALRIARDNRPVAAASSRGTNAIDSSEVSQARSSELASCNIGLLRRSDRHREGRWLGRGDRHLDNRRDLRADLGGTGSLDFNSAYHGEIQDPALWGASRDWIPDTCSRRSTLGCRR